MVTEEEPTRPAGEKRAAGGSQKRRPTEAFCEDVASRLLARQESMHRRLLGHLDRRLAHHHAAVLSLLRALTPAAASTAPPASPPAPLRWTEPEVAALIELRGAYGSAPGMGRGSKGDPGIHWEEISAGMWRLGYQRSAAMCREKWGRMNRYFKNVNGKSKRSPFYFHHLDSLYGNNMLPPPPSHPALQSCVPAADSGNGSEEMGEDMVEELMDWPKKPETGIGGGNGWDALPELV